MKLRVHKKNFNPKTKKGDLNQIFFKLHVNPRRFDFKEKKPIERYKSVLNKVANALKNKGLLKGDTNEVASQTA